MPIRFVNPNYHVILIHYPLGVFVLGVILELFSVLWRRSSVRIAARWMIVIGALLTLPSVTSGIFALHDVRKQGIDAARYHMLKSHVWLMSCASLLAVTCAVIAIGANNRWRRKLYLPLLLGMVGAWVLMTFGAWYGGETIYQQGTAVAIIKVNKVKPVGDDGSAIPAAAAVPEYKTVYKKLPDPEQHSLRDYQDVVKYYVGGDLQQHIIVAGFAFALALGALGLSIRRLSSYADVEVEPVVLERTMTTGTPPGSRRPEAPRRVTDDISVLRSINPEVGLEAAPERVAAGRFWLVAALVIAITAILGYWTLTGQDVFRASGWETFKQSLQPDDTTQKVGRYMAHLALGLGMLALALICGGLAAFAPRRPMLLMLFSTLLILVIAAQIWMGVLMTFDGNGPLTRFKTAADKSRESAAAIGVQGAHRYVFAYDQ
ncbi:MAG TPA: DUF2231 domain-containing protein [Tepidisphaeraceae bacterium]|nr:DUF2231 domain-containing protein [Tepidisphaeraceae bacterium]